MIQNRYPRPFRLGTTSFIYPDHIVPNVRKTGALFDEIELLVFESLPRDVLPSPDDVRTLGALGRDLGLTYNVHLPYDVSLTAEGPQDRQLAADILKQVVSLFHPVHPTSYTLHLSMEKGPVTKDALKAWEERARNGLDLLMPGVPDPSLISVETLWYDPSHFESMVREYGLSVCADLGHHLKYGYDPVRTFDLFGQAVSLIHLHGVDPGQTPPRDHLGLDCMAEDAFGRVSDVLKTFTGTVSLEVFGLDRLKASLDRLDRCFEGIPQSADLP